MSVMENLLKDVNRLTQTAAEPQLSFYSCQACGDTYRSERMLETCPGCKTNARQWPGSTADEARGRAKRAAGVAPSTTNPPEVPNEPVPEPVGVASDSTPEQPKLKTQLDNASGGVGKPAFAGVNPDRVVTKTKRTVKTKAEPQVVQEIAQSNTAPTDAETDYRAAREARIAAFIEKHALNEFQPVPVGTATVQTVGYTLWVGGKPIFRLKESFETGREFAADYNAARAEQPATRIDVAACNKVSDPELEACLYKGDLIVSLNSGHGTETVKPGDTIKIGAYRTRENRLRFAII
jgi:predicted  nucleic acid-binding Zn-ribbon protein